jgi:hypothetical protein
MYAGALFFLLNYFLVNKALTLKYFLYICIKYTNKDWIYPIFMTTYKIAQSPSESPPRNLKRAINEPIHIG